MGASPSNGTPLFRFSGRFIPISRPTPINAGRGLRRPQRLCERCGLCDPQYLIAEAMTLSEMAVLAIDEILLRTEISGRGEEGARRRAFERGPARVRPRQARPSRMTPRDFASERGPARVRPRQVRPSRMIPRDFTSERDSARVRPRQARPSRMTSRDFTSERARRGYGRDKRGPPARRREAPHRRAAAR